MLGTLSGLLGLIYLTAMFSLRFLQLYRQEKGLAGVQRTDPRQRVGIIENTDTKSHDHTQGYTNYHYSITCFLQAVDQMWQWPSGEPSRALGVAS